MRNKMAHMTELSPNGRKIFDLLRRSQKPLSAYEMLDKLRAEGLRAPTTVYRALAALTKAGLVHRIESINAFVACQHHDGHAHIGQFAICTSCGAAEELELEAQTPALQKAGKKFLATINNRVIELSGICYKCSTKLPSKT